MIMIMKVIGADRTLQICATSEATLGAKIECIFYLACH
jgi:hypothetical protein